MKTAVSVQPVLNRPIGLLLCIGLCLGLSGLSSAQTAASTVDTSLVIIPTRTTDAVQADIDNARKAKSEADVRRSAAQSLRDAYDPKIALAKKEIEVIDKKRDLAKKEKRDADLVTLEVEKKSAERVKDLLERQRDLRDAELDVAKGEVDLALAGETVYSLELELMKKRLEPAKSTGTGGSALSLGATQQVVRELEGRTLTAQKEMADKQETVAQRQKKLVERRLQLFESQGKLTSGK